jgi:hypothetical protein
MRKQRTKRPPPQNKFSARNSRRPSAARSGSHPSDFSVEVHIRGELYTVHHALCAGLEQALHFGEEKFPAFAERNPWIAQDSLRRKIWILLDPDTASTT